MATELLDIVDTAVKIGLGALISGVATYSVTNLKHKAEAAQESTKRRRELLVSALDAADDYIFALGDFYAEVDGLRIAHPSATTIEETGETAVVKEHDDALLKTVPRRVHAFSRLKILGEEKAAKALSDYHELEDEMRLKVILEDVLPAEEVLHRWYEQHRSLRNTFLSELGGSLLA